MREAELRLHLASRTKRGTVLSDVAPTASGTADAVAERARKRPGTIALNDVCSAARMPAQSGSTAMTRAGQPSALGSLIGRA